MKDIFIIRSTFFSYFNRNVSPILAPMGISNPGRHSLDLLPNLIYHLNVKIRRNPFPLSILLFMGEPFTFFVNIQMVMLVVTNAIFYVCIQIYLFLHTYVYGIWLIKI